MIETSRLSQIVVDFVFVSVKLGGVQKRKQNQIEYFQIRIRICHTERKCLHKGYQKSIPT